jgi:hypothetical protein
MVIKEGGRKAKTERRCDIGTKESQRQGKRCAAGSEDGVRDRDMARDMAEHLLSMHKALPALAPHEHKKLEDDIKITSQAK